MKVLTPTVRICEYSECQRPLVKKDYETSWRFGRRRFCDPQCLKSHRTRPQTKVCEECGSTYPRRKTNAAEWALRRYCSPECRRKAQPRADTGKRTCEACGVKFERRDNQAIAEFLAQKHCSRPCRIAAQRNEDPPTLAGPHVKYDIDNPPPCFLSGPFFAAERRLQKSIKTSKAGPMRDYKISSQMEKVRDRWCLNCPILSQCQAWGEEEKYTGIAGGEYLVDGVVQ